MREGGGGGGRDTTVIVETCEQGTDDIKYTTSIRELVTVGALNMHHSNSVKINKTEVAFSNFPSIGQKNSTQVHSNVALLTLSFHKLSLLAGLIDGHNAQLSQKQVKEVSQCISSSGKLHPRIACIQMYLKP